MHDPDLSRARHFARLGARHRARKAAWKASGGDPETFAEIMRGHAATGYLHYYEEPVPPRPPHYVAPSVIWLGCLRDMMRYGAVCAVAAAAIILAGAAGYL
ncbi:hypothetical protein E1264_34935 [Actinomadura sp. KC216]|uniref:hypothetical protein n=1 Tax=Actinomadura sp. KC216 TaxID=2530370 RepID=UPI00104ABABD|nr:hypothetical protein [Actinomadura sp. KC216]TDB79841.1 hypothetical protein E1264_34935 [Actinomadura sp. KC216]